jgi:hypothetical protein
VKVLRPGGTLYSGIVNLGSSLTTLGNDAKTGDVWSIGSVSLLNRVAVDGFVKTAGTLTRGSNTTITGAIQQGQPLTAPTLASVSVQFQNGASSVTVANDATRTLAEPGRLRRDRPRRPSHLGRFDWRLPLR